VVALHQTLEQMTELGKSDDGDVSLKPYNQLENPIVRLWHDKNKEIYKIEIRHPDYMAYLNPPLDMQVLTDTCKKLGIPDIVEYDPIHQPTG